MMKKLLVSLLLFVALCVVFIVIKTEERGDVFVSPLWYHISSDSTAEVIKDDSYKELESVVIPSQIQIAGRVYSVTSIGDNAFSVCLRLTSISIPSSVTSIEDGAFSHCVGLKDIEIPSSVTSIENDVFWNCCGLTSIRIPSSVISIGNYAFSDCRALTSIKIPSSVTNIGVFAFKNCKNLDVIIDNSEKNISVGDYAFDDCKSVKFLK